MAEKINGSVCLNHPDTPAVAHCAVCRKPVCGECRQIHDGVSYCSKECHENALRTGRMVDDVVAKRNAIERKRRIRNVILVIVLAAIGAAAYMFYSSNKSEIDAKVKNVKSRTEQKLQEGKKAMDKGLIKDSKYKKERENIIE